jgi:hypothetical protein
MVTRPEETDPMAVSTPTADAADPTASPPRPLLEVTPELADRLRDPRLILAAVAIVGGAIALLVGWYGVSGTYDSAEQTAYLVSGGLGGLFLAGVGAVLISTSNARQAERKIDELQRGLDALAAVVAELRAALPEPAEPAPAAPARRTRKAAGRP